MAGGTLVKRACTVEGVGGLRLRNPLYIPSNLITPAYTNAPFSFDFTRKRGRVHMFTIYLLTGLLWMSGLGIIFEPSVWTMKAIHVRVNTSNR